MDFQGKKSSFNNEPMVYTVAQLKGRRLRMARALTGFSRQELYEKIGIATSTIDTWESGRVELTEKSSLRVCEALRKVGIYCESEWLLFGTGEPPRMMRDIEKSIFSFREPNVYSVEAASNDIYKIPSFLNEDIRRELSFFLSTRKDALFHVLEEDFMNFHYMKGDCVAGEAEDLKDLEGAVVIAQLLDGKTILCKLLRNLGEENEIFFGKKTSTVKMLKAAEIVWHRTSKKAKGKRS